MHARHEVQVWNHKWPWRTRWYACKVIGRHPGPRSFSDAGRTEDWYDLCLRDGSVYEFCNPECVRVKNKG